MFEAYTTGLQEKMLPRDQFKPFPKYEDRKAWKALPEDFRAFLIRKGEEYLGYGWPTALASVYMDFYRNGNRTAYENIIFNKRRLPLQYLVAAECCEGEGRFIDDIINGVWTTLDEATWVIPAHNNQFPVKDPSSQFSGIDESRPLPDTENPDSLYIDLFAAECGAVVSWVYYLMGERLGKEAPQIPARMLGELERRIFTPFLRNKTFGWMGYHGNPVNNWNPWIVSNLMTAAGFACTDEAERAAVVEKGLECIEFFVKGYAPDGGCDEGPGYWNAAGAALFDCLDILCDLTDGKVDFCRDELIRNICSYIYKMHISGKYFVDYADASPIIYPCAQIIYRMGKRTGDKNLTKMGAAAYQVQRSLGTAWKMDGCGCQIYRRMKTFFVESQLSKEGKTDYPLVRDVWFEGIQVMAARMEDGSDKGLYLSAKGGNNGESHNHNDVGSFVLYCAGKPVVIDIGTGVYEKKTFSPQRYEIPQMQSLYHNLPTIGGEGQLPGVEYAAQDVSYSCEKTEAKLSLDLKKMYPETAGIETWRRTFTFDRKAKVVTLEDNFRLKEAREIGFALITPVRPTFTNDTMTVTIDKDTKVTAVFDPALQPEVELFDTEHDANLNRSWGEHVYRTILKLPEAADCGSFRVVFAKQ